MADDLVVVVGAVIGGIFVILAILLGVFLCRRRSEGDGNVRDLIIKLPLPFTKGKKDNKRLKRKRALKKKSTAVPPTYSLVPEAGEEATTESDSSNHSYPAPSVVEDFKPCLLNFSLYYNFHNSHLFVNVISVDNIPSKMFGRSPSSYVKLQLSSDKARVCQTEVHSSNPNPKFHESFEFIGYTLQEISSLSLVLSIHVCDRFSQIQNIGHISIPLDEVEWKPTEPVYFSREIVSKAPRTSSVSSCPESKGELFLSLRYQANANRVSVVVLKALGLVKSSRIFSTDPFVSITLRCDDEVIETKNTKKKKRTINPVWNQSFLFDIDTELLDKYELLFSVQDYDMVFTNSPLGQTMVGPNAKGSGKLHWKEMINKKDTRREVAMSHVLY